MRINYITPIILLFAAVNLYAQEFKTADPKDIVLFPQRNEFRNVLKISGIWKFKKDPDNKGEDSKWYNGLKESRSIAVPGSWNDQFTDMRDYRDWAWYETESYIPQAWKGERIFIRIGEATFIAKVWINGQPAGMHEGASVPFAFDITSNIVWGKSNRISILVENSIKSCRWPGNGENRIDITEYDAFPYAGLNRDVYLYSVPAANSIKDITAQPDIKGKNGILSLIIEQSEKKNMTGRVLISGNGKDIERPIKFQNGLARISVTVPDARPWSPKDPFLYQVNVTLGEKSNPVDEYTLETGIRTISTDKNHILLNGEPVFLRGFGKQEDFPVYGRGAVSSVMIQDFELMKWMGANSYRTSDYPHDEACYALADRQGIMIIAETPAVGLFNTNDTTDLKAIERLANQYLKEMILRDKNHPSVIMWSLANGPKEMPRRPEGDTSIEMAYKLFSDYLQSAKELDPTRLITYMGDENVPNEWLGLADVISINRFAGWTTHNGRIKEGVQTVSEELDELHKTFRKPCMLTQFGASTVTGSHAVQPEMYTEEFQKKMIEAYLNMANAKAFVGGMLISNFADYKTPQSITRLGGYNTKGVLTRDRRPKTAAHFLNERWGGETEKY